MPPVTATLKFVEVLAQIVALPLKTDAVGPDAGFKVTV
jgi:hypothetical protein